VFSNSLLAEREWIDPLKFLIALDQTIAGKTPFHCAAVMKTIGLELWLRSNQTEVLLHNAI
jgi:hypothetical protein